MRAASQSTMAMSPATSASSMSTAAPASNATTTITTAATTMTSSNLTLAATTSSAAAAAATTTSYASNIVNLSDADALLVHQISSQDAQTILTNRAYGAFLFRTSRQPSAVAVSVVAPDLSIVHTLVHVSCHYACMFKSCVKFLFCCQSVLYLTCCSCALD